MFAKFFSNGTQEKKLYKSVLLQNFPDGVAVLKSKPDSFISGFVNFLFDLLDFGLTGASKEEQELYKVDNRLVLTWCTWILCGGSQPNVFLEEMKNKAKPKVCTKVWNDGYYFYRCRDCEMSPSSSICFECFQQGNHEGHDYIFEKSVYGGCCDCGNPHAWKPSGFCPTHTGSFNDDPTLVMDPHIKNISKKVIAALINRLLIYLPMDKPTNPMMIKSETIVSIVNWLRYIGSYGSALIHIIRLEFLSSSLSSTTETGSISIIPVDKLLRSCLYLRDDVLDEILFLFLDLLQDPSFKEKFIRYYVSIYPLLIQHMIKNNGEVNIVYKISPQLFSIPIVTYPLCNESNGLLDIIVTNLHDLFQQLSIIDLRTELRVIDCDNTLISPHNYYAFTNDLNTLLGSYQISSILINDKIDLFITLLHLIELLQGVDPCICKKDEHVEYDSETWKSAFSLEVELSRSIIGVVDGFKHIYGSDNQLSSSVNNNNNSFNRMILVFKSICDVLWKWINHQKIQLQEYNGVEMAKYEVGTDPITFHIPLHRTLSRFIHSAIKIYQDIQIDQLLSLSKYPKEFIILLIEHPLHIHVTLAQERSDMWIRNGSSIINQVYLYRGSYFMESYNCDILLLQSCLIILGPISFFEIILDRFGLRDWFQNDAKIPHPNNELIIVEDFFRFLITVITDRSRIGASHQDIIRREIIHQLAVEDLTHSRLVSELNHKIVEYKEFDSILKDVSIYKAPTDGSPGIYCLKTELWREFDPFFPRYEPQSLQKAMERYAPNKPKEHPSINLNKTYGTYTDVINLLHVPHLHNIYHTVLYYSLQSPLLYDAILRTILHLILITIDNRIDFQNKNINSSSSSSSIISSSPSNHYYPSYDIAINSHIKIKMMNDDDISILDMIIKMYKMSSQFKDQMDYIIPILKKLSLIDNTNRSIIRDQLPDFEKGDAPIKDHADEEMKRKAKERQAALLAQFANQQKAFMKSFEEYEEEEEEEEEEQSKGEATKKSMNDYDTISSGALCALCRSEAPESEGRILGFVGFIQSTRIPKVAKDQDTHKGLRNKHKKSLSDSYEDRTEPKKPYFTLSDSPRSTITTISSSSGLRSPLSSSLSSSSSSSLSYFINNNNNNTRDNNNNEIDNDNNDDEDEDDNQVIDEDDGISNDDNDIDNNNENDNDDMMMQISPSSIITTTSISSRYDRLYNKHIDDTDGIHVSHCGHCMHDDCFSLFFNDLSTRYHQLISNHRLSPTNVSRGEFFCPICRRLSNTLIPIISKDYNNNQEVKEDKQSSVDSFGKWLEKLPTMIPRTEPNQITTLPGPIRSTLIDLGTRMYCTQYDISVLESPPISDSDMIPYYLDSIITSISHIEILSRHKQFTTTVQQQLTSLNKMIRCARTVPLSSIQSRDQIIEYLIHSITRDPNSNDDDKMKQQQQQQQQQQQHTYSIISHDMFSLLTRITILLPSITYNNILYFIQLLYVSNVIQIFMNFFHYQSSSSSSSNYQISNSELLMDLFLYVKKSVNSANIPVGTYLEKPPIGAVMGFVHKYTVSFLRRSIIYLHSLFPDQLSLPNDLPMDHDSLIKLINLSSIDTIIGNDKSINNMIKIWVSQLVYLNSHPPFAISVPRLGPSKLTRLIELPTTFQELLLQYMGVKCKTCKTVPKQGGICLLCGALCCVASQCCLKNDTGECARHTVKCPCGIFLILKSTYILIINGEKRSVWGSLYLDDHGEEDPSVRRGKTLYLNRTRYDELLRLWLSQSFYSESKILFNLVHDGNLM